MRVRKGKRVEGLVFAPLRLRRLTTLVRTQRLVLTSCYTPYLQLELFFIHCNLVHNLLLYGSRATPATTANTFATGGLCSTSLPGGRPPRDLTREIRHLQDSASDRTSEKGLSARPFASLHERTVGSRMCKEKSRYRVIKGQIRALAKVFE